MSREWPMRIHQRITRITTRASVVCVLGGVAALGLTACATSSGGLAQSTRIATNDARPSSATLTADEIDRVPDALNALEAVRQLRPLFLRPRPSPATFRGQPPVLAVYINGMYAG